MIFETIETALEAHPVLSAAIHLGAVTVCLTFFLYLTGTRKKQVESTKDDKTFAYDIEGKSHFRPAKESANRNPSPAAEPGKSLQSNPPAPPPPGIHLPRSAPIRLEVIPEPAAENPSSNAEAAATTDAQDVTQAKDQSPGNIPSSAKPDEKDFTIRFPEGMPPVDTQDTDPVAHHTKEEIAIRIYQIFQGKDAETLIAIDREEHILALNPGAEKLFQYPSHELRGKKIEDIIFLEPGDKTGTPASGSDPFDDDDDKQRAKGHAKDGSSFPVGVELEMADRPLGIILVRIHTMDLLLQPGKPVFEDLPAVEPEATRDSASTIGAIAATAAAPEPETPVVEEAESTPQTELSDTNDELTDSETASDTEPESAEPEAADLKPIGPVAEEISEAQDTPDESAPQPETTSETEQADGNIAPSPEPEGVLEAEPVADGAPVQETEPEAVGSEPEAIPESIPATETASLTEAPSAPVESGPNSVEPTEEATAPEPETPAVEEAESTPQTELSDTNDELTDSETASDTEPESAEPEAVNIEPIEPVAEEIPEAQDTPDESAPQPETTPEPEQADGIIAPSPEPEETLETESVADVAPVQETEPEAVGSEPEAIPEPEAKPTAGIALEPVEEQPESTPVPEPETDTTNPTEDPLSETGFISHDQGNQTQDLPATTEAAVEAAEITGTDISTTEAVTPSNDAPDASPQESLPSLGSIEQPLHSISRIAKLMAVEQPDAQRIKEYAEAIEERSNRMAEQIEELKSMLKQARTQGAASSKQGPIDISRLAEILVNEASSLVSSSDKRVQCNLLDADSLYGLGNESGLTQVINSLIDLGLHCIDSGCVHIDVRSDANEPLESISESYDLNGKTLVPDSKREVIIQTRFQTSPSIRKYLESAFGPNPDFDAIEDDPAIAILAGIASRIRLSVRAMNGRFIFETPVADEVMVQTQWDMQCLREEI